MMGSSLTSSAERGTGAEMRATGQRLSARTVVIEMRRDECDGDAVRGRVKLGWLV